MPSLNELRNRFSIESRRQQTDVVESDESLVVDERSHLRPAQIIELKLGTALGRGPILRFESTEALPNSRAAASG